MVWGNFERFNIIRKLPWDKGGSTSLRRIRGMLTTLHLKPAEVEGLLCRMDIHLLLGDVDKEAERVA